MLTGGGTAAGEGPVNSCIERSEELGEAEEADRDHAAIGFKLPSVPGARQLWVNVVDCCLLCSSAGFVKPYMLASRFYVATCCLL